MGWPGLLAFVSGAAALAHQIIWTRRFVDILGADANTFSKVIGAFFVGLALGAALAPRFLAGSNPWVRVALAETLVATLALPALFSHIFGKNLFGFASLSWPFKLFLPVLLISPPAFAMGLVLPLFVSALPRWTLRIYAINTLGGVVGVLGALLFLLPRFGITRSGLCAIGLNLVVAVGALLFRDRGSAGAVMKAPSLPLSFNKLALLAFGSGYAILGSEVILQQQLAQVAINSSFSSGFVLAMVLVSLGVAALLLPLLLRFSKNFRATLGAVLLASALLCLLEPFQLVGLRPNLEMLPYELPALRYVLELLKLAGLTVCPMVLLAGLLFPLLLHGAAQFRQLATLLAWNGLGGWLGAEITHAVMLPRCGLWISMCTIGGIYLGLLLTVQSWPTRRWTGALGAVALVVSVFFARTLPQVTTHPSERLAAVAAGREGMVATVRTAPDDWRMLFNNTYTLGGSKARYNQERQALLPLLLHRQPAVVACLGVATGSTVAGASLHPQVERIDAIELSPLVLEQAEQWFTPFNRHVFANPRVQFIREDARWVIARRKETYDAVIGDLFLPWRTGEGRLFALEHFQNVRASLKTNGLFCQWLPMFQLTRPQFETILRTFQKVFPEVWLLRGDFYTELPILGLLGGQDLLRLDWDLMRAICQGIREVGTVTDPLVRHPEGVAMMIVGPAPRFAGGRINTLGNGWLEWNAAQNIIGLKEPWFIGVPCAEYIRDIHRLGQTSLPASLRAAHDAGQFFLTLEIAVKLQLPASVDLQSQIPSRIPQTLWRDPAAAWQAWPARIKPSPFPQ